MYSNWSLTKITKNPTLVINNNNNKGFAMGSLSSVLMAFSQSYVEHNLKKNKIVVPFFC
jgi:hypothetical protein